MEWIKANVLPLVSLVWLCFLLYRSWRQEVEMKALQNNHLKTVEEDIKEIKARLNKLEETTVQQWREIDKIKVRLNGK